MAFSESALLELGYIEEVTWGTTPGTPELTALRIISESLKKDFKSVVSGEIRSDRQIPDAVIVGGQAAGGLGFELSYGEFDTLFEHLMMASFVAGQTITGTDLSLSGAQLQSGGSSFDLAKNKVGQWIVISGSATGSNNGLYRISAATTAALDLEDEQGVTASFTADSANASLSYKSSDRLRNGTTKKSLTLEKGHTDNNLYQQYTGMRVSQMSLEFPDQDIITGALEFIGKDMTAQTGTIDNDSSYTASQTNSILNTADHLRRVWYDGAEATEAFKTMNLTMNNGLRPQTKLGSAGLAGVGVGRFNVSGNVEMYFQDHTMLNAFLNNTYKSFVLVLDDDPTSAEGNKIIVTLPRVKFLEQENPAPQSDTDIMQTFSMQATRESSEDYTMQIERLAA